MERGETVKRCILIFLGSLFLQIFCWVMYSLLEMRIWMCGLSALVTALLYHFLQTEEQTGLSRKNVFFAAILAPFVMSLAVTVIQLWKYPNLSLLSASLDGVSPMTETVSLYATRLALNGVILLIFAAIDRAFLRKPKKEQKDEKSS